MRNVANQKSKMAEIHRSIAKLRKKHVLILIKIMFAKLRIVQPEYDKCEQPDFVPEDKTVQKSLF